MGVFGKVVMGPHHWVVMFVVGSFYLHIAQGMAQRDGNMCSPIKRTGTRFALGSKSSLLHTLLKDYDSLIRPQFEEGIATDVTCDIFVNSVDSISVETMDYSVNIYMRQTWVDPRLVYKDKPIFYNISKLVVDHGLFDQIWVPDLFFPNEKNAHQHFVTVPNKLIWIYPDGKILYSARYTLILACHMDLKQFPLDKQNCKMRIESYGFTVDDLRINWNSSSPVQINEDLRLPEFELSGHTQGPCSASYVTGDFSCLELQFMLTRQYGYFMILTYIPSFLIVLLSWVSFWINTDAVPARISLGVLTVLTLTTHCAGVWMSLSMVSYVKAIDLWMSMCVIFVFAAILEFAIVNSLSRKEIREMNNRSKSQENGTNKVILAAPILSSYDGLDYFDPNSRRLARKVDKISRALFPISFFIFCIVYWCVYLL